MDTDGQRTGAMCYQWLVEPGGAVQHPTHLLQRPVDSESPLCPLEHLCSFQPLL
jgi:hypothetical protein